MFPPPALLGPPPEDGVGGLSGKVLLEYSDGMDASCDPQPTRKPLNARQAKQNRFIESFLVK